MFYLILVDFFFLLLLLFFSLFSIAITSLGEERAYLGAFVRLFDLRLFVVCFFFFFFFFFLFSVSSSS